MARGCILLATLYLLGCSVATAKGSSGKTTASHHKPLQATTCPASVASKLGACVPILGGVLGDPLLTPCCALLLGLPPDEDPITCLCSAIDAGALGVAPAPAKPRIIVNILITCGFNVPPNLSCP